jgi:hypothetical protein
MPYKDHEKSRSYQREYKRRQRAKARMSNPMCPTMLISVEASQALSLTVKRKAYICAKVPHYRLPCIAFKNGIFVTDQSEEQGRIESNPLYGEEIFS